MKAPLISDTIEEYRENYRLKTGGKLPGAIPLTKIEFENMVFVIRRFIMENPDNQTVYYMEGIEDEEPVMTWKNSEIYINPESIALRKSIMP